MTVKRVKNQFFSRQEPRLYALGRILGAVLILAAAARAQADVRYTFAGANVGDEFGSVINFAGDLNLDGFDDVIIGAPFDLPALGHPGSATVYSGANGSVLLSLHGTAPNQAFGFGVAPAGDINHDGVPDLLIGQSGNGSTGLGPGGGARVFSGATGLPLLTFAGSVVNDAFGQSLDTLGDINGDGYADIIVGTAFAPSSSQPGYAKVFSGANGAVLYTKTGTFGGERFGIVSAAGDVNGDGICDFIIGAIGDHVNGTNSGSAFVYSGATGALLFSVHGTAANNQFGYSVRGIGDVNGDGFGEVIVGTYIPAGMGYARVYSGANGSVLYDLNDGVIGDAFGHTVSGVGDVNGDGTNDFAVSAPNSALGGTNSGRMRVFSGADGSILRDFIGSSPNIHFGYSINPAGDVNGDKMKDIAVGALVPGSTGNPGQARVVSVGAAQPFGLNLAPNELLSMSWIPGAPGYESQGGPSVSGAAPYSNGILAASLGSTQSSFFDVPVLLDISPGFLLTLDIAYNESGHVDFPVNLRNPGLSGVTLYVQAFELNPAASQGIYASNGLQLLFTN